MSSTRNAKTTNAKKKESRLAASQSMSSLRRSPSVNSMSGAVMIRQQSVKKLQKPKSKWNVPMRVRHDDEDRNVARLSKKDAESYSLRHVLSSNAAREVVSTQGDLQKSFASLDLVTISFSQLIQELGVSKAELALLLGRIRDTYTCLYKQLIDNVLVIEENYHARTNGVLRESDEMKIKLEGQVNDLKERVRLLTRVSMAKDAILTLSNENSEQMEIEMEDLRYLLMSETVSSVPRTVWPGEDGKQKKENNNDDNSEGLPKSNAMLVKELALTQEKLMSSLDYEFKRFDEENNRNSQLLNGLNILLDDTNPAILKDSTGKGIFTNSLELTNNEQLESKWSSATQTEEIYTEMNALVSVYDCFLPSPVFFASNHQFVKEQEDFVNIKQPKDIKLDIKGNYREPTEIDENKKDITYISYPSNNNENNQNNNNQNDSSFRVRAELTMSGNLLPAPLRMFLSSYINRKKEEEAKPINDDIDNDENRFINKGLKDSHAQALPSAVMKTNTYTQEEIILLVKLIYHDYLNSIKVHFHDFLCQYFLIRSGYNYSIASTNLLNLLSSAMIYKVDDLFLLIFTNLSGILSLPLPTDRDGYYDMIKSVQSKSKMHILCYHWFKYSELLNNLQKPFYAHRIEDNDSTDAFGEPIRETAWLNVKTAQSFHESIFLNPIIQLPNLGWIKKKIRVWLIDNMGSVKSSSDHVINGSYVKLDEFLFEISYIWDEFLRRTIDDFFKGLKLNLSSITDNNNNNIAISMSQWRDFLKLVNEKKFLEMNEYSIASTFHNIINRLQANPSPNDTLCIDITLQILEDNDFIPIHMPYLNNKNINNYQFVDFEKVEPISFIRDPIAPSSSSSTTTRQDNNNNNNNNIEETSTQTSPSTTTTIPPITKLDSLRSNKQAVTTVTSQLDTLTLKVRENRLNITKMPLPDLNEASRLLDTVSSILKIDTKPGIRPPMMS